VVVPLADDGIVDAGWTPLLQRVVTLEGEIVVRLDSSQIPRNATDKVRPLRASVGALEKTVGGAVRAALGPIESRTSEAQLGRAGFRSLIPAAGKADASPRPAAVFEGQPRIGAVFPAGPYAGDCGSRPDAGPLTPPAADRITQAIHAAARVGGAPVVRVALDGRKRSSADADVLGRWLDEVIVPSTTRLVTPNDARKAALKSFRAPTTASTEVDLGGRMVSAAEVRRAAEALDDVTVIPRSLPGELTATEAFQAFALLLADQTEGGSVRLRELRGPRTLAESSLTESRPVSVDALRQLATALLAELPAEVPAALPVDGALLTAPELLLAFASAVEGDQPATTRPVAVLDPNAEGLGWGASTTP